MLKRAYSVLHVKEYEKSDDYFIFSGTATTPKPDRYGDIVEPKGGTFQNPMPMLWQHRSDKPVGTVDFGQAADEGIPFTARLPYIKEEGALKEQVDEAIHSVKYGLVRAVSIGFSGKKYEWLEDGSGIHFKEWECLELSLVTIPANSEAIITEIKSIDQQRVKSIRAIPKHSDQTVSEVGASTKKVVQIRKI